MTTVERLFAQIFERKNSIVEQVKQQTELYCQHLASKALIDGIIPPSWLWNPNTSDSEGIFEVNKEELISKLLYPYPQPSSSWCFAHYPGYDNSVTTGDNKEFCHRFTVGNPAFSRSPGEQDAQTIHELKTHDHAECSPNCAPKFGVSVVSPADQTDKRIFTVYNAPDPSLSGIKGSKSRPKALKLRSSAEGLSKSGLRHGNICDQTISVLNTDDHAEFSLNCAAKFDNSVPSPEDQTDKRIFTIYTVPDQSPAGIKRSKSRQEALELRSGAKALAKSGMRHENIGDVVSSQNDELPQLEEPCAIDGQICQEMNLDEADDTSREMGMDTFSDRMTRSRSCTEVPNSVKGSFTLCCSSEDCKENVFFHVPKTKNTESMPISRSEHADNHIMLPKSAGPSTICCQSCGERRVGNADFLSKDKDTNVHTGKITRSKISGEQKSCGCDSSKADSSGNYQGITINMMGSGFDLLPEFVVGSLAKVNFPNVNSEGCDALDPVSVDFERHKVRDNFPSKSSIQHDACIEEVCDLKVSSFSAKVNGGIFAPSDAVSAGQINNSHEVSRLVEPAAGLFHRLTRPQTRPNDQEIYQPVAHNENPSFKCTISKSECKQKSADELQNNSSGPSAQACYGAHCMLQDDNNNNNRYLVIVRDLVLHDNVDHSRSSNSSYYAKQRRELKSCVAQTPLYSFALQEPKQFEFKDVVYNLEAFTSGSGKRSLDNSPETMNCSSSVSGASLDKGIHSGANQLPLSKQSSGMSDVISKGVKTHKDSFEFDVQKNPDTHTQILGLVISNTMSKAPECFAEAGKNSKFSEVDHVADSMLSKINDIPDMQIHQMKSHVEHECESSRVKQLEEGDWSGEEKDEGQLFSNASESKNLSLSHSRSSPREPRAESYGCLIKNIEMTNPIALDETKQFPVQQSDILSCLEGEVCTPHGDSSLGDNALGTHCTVRLPGENSSLFERRFRHTNTESWPQMRRRKIERQIAHYFTGSPSFRVKKPHSFRRDLASTHLKAMETNVDTAFMVHVNKYVDAEICPEMNCYLMEGIESPVLCQDEEVGSCCKEKNERKNSLSDINSEQLGRVSFVASSSIEDSRNSQGCLSQIRNSLSTSNLLDSRRAGSEHYREHLCNLEKNAANLNSENMKISDTLFEGIQSPKWEGGLHTRLSVLSSSHEDLHLTGFDQSMPEFERFTVDAQPDCGELNFDLDKLNLPESTLERASILVDICRSISLGRPSVQLSPAFEFQGTQNVFHYVPRGGHLEHLDLRDYASLSSGVGKHLHSGSSASGNYKDVIDGMPYSVSLACSGPRYGGNSRNHPSPIGKLWNRLSSHTVSSGKRLSSNPELNCFPIEEDASISEENKTLDDNAGDLPEEIDSSLANHEKRKPLKDLTNLSSSMSVSAEEEISNTDNVDFANTKFSITGTQEKVHRGPEYRYKKKRETSEKQTSFSSSTDGRKSQTSFVGAKGIRKAKHSMNRISRPIVSNKASLKGQNHKLSLKESTRNNIVSNVSSFIPLIQQKKPATACAGKRDVKVKALEAAEAAKRLEEKKENERKLKKEALKLERAKLEEKKLRHVQLEKKRKEEERKKKDADIIAKKRLREDEEKKEKKKKRMRLEARQQQMEHEGKKHAEKAEKENQRSKDEQINSKKEFHDETKKNRDTTTTGQEVALQKAETKLTPTGVVMNHEECGTSGLSYEAEKAMHTADKSPKNEALITQNSQGKSYEISPYQCSDDEYEEEVELSIKKSIPSWASKSSVALFLPMRQEMDPDVIFPPESFCSMDEVLLPRKLQRGQVSV